MCSEPLTLGGGSTIEYGGLPLEGSASVTGVDPALIQLCLYRTRVPAFRQGIGGVSWVFGAELVTGRF